MYGFSVSISSTKARIYRMWIRQHSAAHIGRIFNVSYHNQYSHKYYIQFSNGKWQRQIIRNEKKNWSKILSSIWEYSRVFFPSKIEKKKKQFLRTLRHIPREREIECIRLNTTQKRECHMLLLPMKSATKKCGRFIQLWWTLFDSTIIKCAWTHTLYEVRAVRACGCTIFVIWIKP